MNNKFNSFDYWEQRYRSSGLSSGNGSYGRLAAFKAEVINSFIEKQNVESVLDFGCGDGNQASLFDCRKYIGYDISKTAINLCRKKFEADATKTFTDDINDLKPVDLTLSCEVLFHLINFDVFMQYLQKLFKLSNRFVIIYSSNSNSEDMLPTSSHIRHRNFTLIVSEHFSEWKFVKRIPNRYPEECFSDFYIYEKIVL